MSDPASGNVKRPRMLSGWAVIFLAWAAGLSLAYLACHVGGMRQYVGFLTGTKFAAEGNEVGRYVMAGGVYVLLHFCFVLLVPILVLASAILTVWERFATRRRGPGDQAREQREAR